MTTRIAAVVLICVLATCQQASPQTTATSSDGTSKNDRAASVNKAPRERPDLDFTGLYNMPRSAFKDKKVNLWVESKNIPEPDVDEFDRVNSEVIAALSKHGIANPKSGGDYDFFVRMDKFYDRSQSIKLKVSERLPKILAPAVNEVQKVLKKHPRWRAVFDGFGDESQCKAQYFVVYPEVVRIRQLDMFKKLEDAVTANAQLRLVHQGEQTKHQQQRIVQIAEATRSAFAKMAASDQDVILVAWFDNLSSSYSNWGFEGKAGMSAWFLLRRPIPDDRDDYLQSDSEYLTVWAQPDGSISETDENRKADSRQLVHFENYRELQTELLFRLNGKQYRFTR